MMTRGEAWALYLAAVALAWFVVLDVETRINRWLKRKERAQ